MESEKNVGMSEQDLENLLPDESAENQQSQTQDKTQLEPELKEKEPTDQELAEAALQLTDEHDPKDAVIGGFRRKLRDAELENARLQGIMEAQKKPPETEKSPVELAAEEQEVSVDDVVIDGKLLKQQRQWEKQQEKKEQEQNYRREFEQAGVKALEEMSDEVYGEGLGLASLNDLGKGLLTRGDLVDIYEAGKNCGKVMMQKLRYRIIEVGGEKKAELLKRVKTHKSQTSKKQEDKGKSERKVPTQEDVLERADPYLESIFFSE
jgi:hypothetical protein